MRAGFFVSIGEGVNHNAVDESNGDKLMNTMLKSFSIAAFLTSAGLAHAQDAEPPAAPTSATDKESVIMVLDGSGSMWGQIDGKPKIEIARGVIGGLLEDWDENIHLGLVAYGHREKGACGDIETLVDVGPVNSDALMTKINAINPVGKTPISASVQQAADALKFTEEKATVILVSDGLETCEADPCALANELESKGVDFTAHVIGFDVAEEEQANLSCLAENTGGQFISAQNAGELTTAMAQTVEAVKAPEPVAAAPEPAPEVEPVAEAGPQGVKLSAKLCETCEILDDGVYWRIYEGEKKLDGNRKKLKATGSASPFVELVEGDYYIVSQYGKAKPGENVMVESGKTTAVNVNLNAGHLRVNALATEGGEALDDKMYYRVYSAKTGLDGSRDQIDVSGGHTPTFKLPAGDYVVQAAHGKAKSEQTLTVTAGELTENTFNMNVGYLRLTGEMAAGKGAIESGLYYRVYEAKANLAGDRKQIDASGSDKPLFRLPAGDYVVVLRHGKATTETPITVSAGSMTEKNIVQNSGQIKATAVLETGGGAANGKAYWRVYDGKANLDGNRKQIDASGSAQPVFTLSAGDYVLAVKFGEKTTETEFSLAAGEEKVLEVKVNP